MLPFKVLSHAPRIVVFPSFLTADEMEYFIAKADASSRDSTVVDHNGNPVVSGYRTGKISDIPKEESIAVLVKLAEVTKTETKQAEGFQVIRYSLTNEYKEHTDWFDPRIPAVRKVFKKGGQRIFSVVIGLKEADEGGELYFKAINLKFKIHPGDAVIFENVKPNGVPDAGTIHAALPVTKGEKLVVVTWLRERAFDGSEEPEEGLFYKQEQRQIKAMRQDACSEELPKFLQHYGCILAIEAVPVISEDGSVRVESTVKVKAVDVKEE
jgi:prolyl 4-hydroxylase